MVVIPAYFIHWDKLPIYMGGTVGVLLQSRGRKYNEVLLYVGSMWGLLLGVLLCIITDIEICRKRLSWFSIVITGA